MQRSEDGAEKASPYSYAALKPLMLALGLLLATALAVVPLASRSLLSPSEMHFELQSSQPSLTLSRAYGLIIDSGGQVTSIVVEEGLLGRRAAIEASIPSSSVSTLFRATLQSDPAAEVSLRTGAAVELVQLEGALLLAQEEAAASRRRLGEALPLSPAAVVAQLAEEVAVAEAASAGVAERLSEAREGSSVSKVSYHITEPRRHFPGAMAFVSSVVAAFAVAAVSRRLGRRRAIPRFAPPAAL